MTTVRNIPPDGQAHSGQITFSNAPSAPNPALSIVGRGIVGWLHHHGPATTRRIADHYTETDLNRNEQLEALRIIAAELRHLETLGHVRRIHANGTATWDVPR